MGLQMVTHMEGWLPRHRITVDEYYRMAEVGLLAQDARVELIEGEIIDRAPIGSRHAAAVDRLDRLLQRAVGDCATVWVQGPIRLSKSSEPQPDVALLKHRDDFYETNHPTALDTLLAIEVSDTTFRYDREVKVPLYARHGVLEIWIVDLKDRRVHFLRAPAGGKYTDISTVSEPAETGIGALPGSAIDLSGIFGA